MVLCGPMKEKPQKEKSDGWNYHLPNQEQQYFFSSPFTRTIYMPAVARPRVWTNPNLR